MIKIFKFRKNDLNPSLGKQVEFNKSIVDSFFKFNTDEVDIYITYKSLNSNDNLNNKVFKNELRLSRKRGDYKIYTNDDSSENIKDLFIKDLGLNESKNIDDYFALIKKDNVNYDLFYLPESTSISTFYKLIKNDVFDYEHTTSDDEFKKSLDNLSLLAEYAIWLNNHPRSNYYENNYDRTLKGLQRINEKYIESFGDDLFVVNNNDVASKIETIDKNIWDENSAFWKFSESTSSHMPRAILNKDNYQNFLREYDFNRETTNSYTIYYGAPGTGKSYKVDQIIKNLEKQFYERVTFHPEYDNASFIGGYKPVSVKNEEGKDVIKYEFVPQAFTTIYKRAWQDLGKQYYLVIEEINRGNCAEIFGELFQLLDRNSGYTVAPSNELYKYLVEELGDENHNGIVKGLELPPNLAILATMNTSDQSLFPMDSAFKRRWEWEYVPICYLEVNEEGKENKSYNFEIDLGNGSKYSWIKFIKCINIKHIKENPNLGMDKCIGNYFVRPEMDNAVSLKQFINKVIFYLWNDVFKDEENSVFEENSSYEDFFPITTNGLEKIIELFVRIGLEPNSTENKQEDSLEIATEEPQSIE